MSVALLSIGVNQTGGGLDPLRGAVADAGKMAAWAQTQDYDTVVSLTDGDGTPVTAERIIDAIDAIIQTGTCRRLVIYFAGHGVLVSQQSEFWLLSKAPTRANEAVNVPHSIQLARNSGIPHIVLISDACRTLAQRPTMAGLLGSPIFPNLPTRPDRSEVDIFYATLPGDPSAEAADEKARAYQGIFTSCLLDGLKGTIATLRQRLDGADVVASRPLKKYLANAVPLKASAVSDVLEQTPDAIVESGPESYLARFPVELSALPPPAPAPAPVAEMPAPAAAIASAVARVEEARGRESFETQTGFTVVGTRIARAVVTAGTGSEVFTENGADHVRVHHAGRPASALITFEDGTGVCFAVLPGYVGTILVEPGIGTSALNYTPARSNYRYADFYDLGDAIERRRAHAAVAARMGLFRMERAELVRYADQQRQMKFVDPAMGIYACYALAQAGAIGEVREVRRYMSYDWDPPGGPLVFDIEMLAHPEGPPAGTYEPGMPMLTQGWPLLGAWRDILRPAVRAAQPCLMPSLWTTFSAKGHELLTDAFERGEL